MYKKNYVLKCLAFTFSVFMVAASMAQTYKVPALFDTDFTTASGYTTADLSTHADWTRANNPLAWNVDASTGMVTAATNWRGVNLSSAPISAWAKGTRIKITQNVTVTNAGASDFYLGLTSIYDLGDGQKGKNTPNEFVGAHIKLNGTDAIIKAGKNGANVFTSAGGDFALNTEFQLVMEIMKSTTADEFDVSFSIDGGTAVIKTFAQAPVYNASGNIFYTAYIGKKGGEITFSTLKIEEEEVAQLPLAANAGAPQTVVGGTAGVQLTGSSNYDGDANYTITYDWTAPAGVTLSATNISNPTFTAPDQAKIAYLNFILTVTAVKISDGSSLNAQASVLLTVTPASGMYGGGTGDVLTPYLIASVDHLYNLSMTNNTADWSKNYKLMGNLDMASTSFTVPIGNPTTSFSGAFDGNHYEISNLTINVADTYGTNDGIGLIGNLTGSVMNLGIKNIQVNEPGKNRIGAIAGQMNGAGSITNCYAIGGSLDNGSSGWVGSIAGVAFSSTNVIRDCIGSVTIASNWGAAGILGSIRVNSTVIENVVYYGTLVPKTDSLQAITYLFHHADLTKEQVTDGGAGVVHAYYISTANSGKDSVGISLTAPQLRDSSNLKGFDWAATWQMMGTHVSGNVFTGFATLKSFGQTPYEYTVSPSVLDGTGVNGSISPNAVQTAQFGEALSFNFSTSTQVADVWIDGVQQNMWDNPTSYTFMDITKMTSRTIGVLFAYVTPVDDFIGTPTIFSSGMRVTVLSLFEQNILDIYDLSGNLVCQKIFKGRKFSQVLNLNQGVYVVQLNNGQQTQKVILK